MRRVLRSSDFSNIEGRIVAWLAGQEDKLDAFRAFDEGTGPDLYLVAAAGIFNVPVKDAKPFRQIGKVAELSMGYGGGAKAFAKMAKNYGVRIAQQYDGIWPNVAEYLKDEALAAWDDRGRKTGMSEKAWLASEVIKLGWRAKNHRIAAYWKETEDAVVKALKNKGEIITCGKVKFRQVGSFLFCLSPSGNTIVYPYPHLKEKETPWGEMRPQIVYKCIDQFTRKWGDTTTYGASVVENETQFIARNIMAEAMLRVDAAGHAVVLTVHDEIITEDDADFGSMDEFNALMTQVPAWATGLPISVGGWQGSRYHK